MPGGTAWFASAPGSGISSTVGDPGHVQRYAAPVIAAEALLVHGIQDAAILEYLAGTWGLSRSEAASALAGSPSRGRRSRRADRAAPGPERDKRAVSLARRSAPCPSLY